MNSIDKAYDILIGLRQLERALESEDPSGELRVRVDDLITQVAILHGHLRRTASTSAKIDT